MNYPLIYFVDRQGKKLPEEDGCQHYRQYGGSWAVEIEGDWNGTVGLLGETEIFHLTKISPTQWVIPENDSVGKEIATRSGFITAVMLDSNLHLISRPSQAQLWISPGGLSESNLNEIIAEIGFLALSVGSLVRHQASTPVGEQTGSYIGQSMLSGDRLLPTAQALLDLYRSIRNVWTEIEKRPLRSFRSEMVAVDVNRKLNSPQALISRILNPSKKQIITTGSVESLDCSENQFLCYLLDIYLHNIAGSLIESIENNLGEEPLINANYFPSGDRVENKTISHFLGKARNRYESRQSKLTATRTTKLQVLSDLHECTEWSKNVRNNYFLSNVVTPDTPNLSSQRLIKSHTYGSILEAYNKYNGGHLSDIRKIIRLYQETVNLSVKKTWELYEIWCFVKLYSALAIQLRLKLPANAENLFESIQLDNGELSIPKNIEFRLHGKLNNRAIINISLWYEPEEKGLRPDFKLKIAINRIENTYYFDAKYRNYKNQKVQQFIDDVVGTAKNKYLNKLSAKTSFIFHSDSRFDFWGEVPLESFIQSHFSEQSSEVKTGYINHAYGAISLIPGISADRQIDRMIRLIFQYHNQFCTTCLNCGCEAETQTSWIPDYWSEQTLTENIINRVSGSWGGAIYCSCKQCGDFWVVQRCYKIHHRLLKFANSFHKRSPNYPGSWIYLCPECGGDLNQEG
jgi:hypothetical protein